ncbi:MAG: hypothetical protein ACC645_05365 [Pirellulales bacterium]
MTEQTFANWSLWTGSCSGDAAEWLNDLTKTHKPLLVWCEPVNGRSRRNGFGLVDLEGLIALPKRSLAEARLFYDDGLVHVVAAEDGLRFAAWREGMHEQVPAWCPAGATPPSDQQEGASSPKAMLRTKTQRIVLLNTSAGTRGLDVTHVGDAVRAVEYYESGVLRWWRLEAHVPEKTQST